jgi:hypothetical protein
METRDFRFVIDLPVQNHWENVDLLRSSVQNCFTAIFQDVEGVNAFATVAAELLENAIKYGKWSTGDGTPRLHLRVWGDGERANVQVENPVDESSPELKELIHTIEWLKTFPSAEEAYRARLLEVATSPRGVSKIGLARIAYEGKCALSAEIERGVLRVTGVSRF